MALPSIGRILSEADWLFEQSMMYLGRTLNAEGFARFYSHLASKLGVYHEHVEQSVQHLHGKELNRDLLQQVCIRLMANRRTLQSQAVPLWRGQSKDEWCMAIIAAARLSHHSKGDKGGLFKFYIVTGTAAGTTTTTWWSHKLCVSLARRLGFPRRRGEQISRIYYRHPRDLVRLRIAIKLTAGATGVPQFREAKVPESAASYNRQLLKKRFRISLTCPEGYDDNFPCHNCPHGYNACPMATHRADFDEKDCPRCKREDVTFDTEFSSKVCLDCLEKENAKTQETAEA